MEFLLFFNVNICTILVFSLYLNVHGLHIKEGPENQTVRVGSETTLYCNVDGRRDWEYVRWYSYTLNKYISNNWEILNTINADQIRRFSILRGVSGDRSYDLKITNAQTVDSGNYECVYVDENDVVLRFEPRAEASLNVLSPVENGVQCHIEVDGGVSFSAGNVVRFICTTFYTNRHTKLKLLHNGKKVKSTYKYVGEKMVTMSSRYPVNDESTFTCRLRIDDGNLETCQLNLLPSGNVTLQHQTVQAGDTAEFNCYAIGFKNSRLTYTWHFIPDHPPDLYFTSNSTVTIRNVQIEYNATVVTCTVSGAGTVRNATAILFVQKTSNLVVLSIVITCALGVGLLISIMCICFFYKRRSEHGTVFNKRHRTPSRRTLTPREYPTARRENTIERHVTSRNDTLSSSVKIRQKVYTEMPTNDSMLRPGLSKSVQPEVEMNEERDTVYENVDPFEVIEDFSLMCNTASFEVEMKCRSSHTDGLKYAELDLPYSGTIIHDTCYKVTYSEVRL